jgi:hypothetical protein
MPITYGFEVRPICCNVQVAADCLETYTILERYVFPSLPRLVGTTDKPDIFIRLDRVADQSQLSVDGVVVASAGHAISLVPDLIRILDDAVIQRLTAMHAVHAGAVLWGERALLLPGVTHAGKSSLVAELLRRGATYFSDEYALIDSSGRVHPYPRPLLLRNGSPEQSPVLPAECNAPTGDTPAPVGWILSLEYVPESTWSVSAVSQSEALLILLRNTPQILSESPDMVAVFQRAVAGATCYAGHRPDADEAVSQILQLIGSPHLTQPVSQDKTCRS